MGRGFGQVTSKASLAGLSRTAAMVGFSGYLATTAVLTPILFRGDEFQASGYILSMTVLSALVGLGIVVLSHRGLETIDSRVVVASSTVTLVVASLVMIYTVLGTTEADLPAGRDGAAFIQIALSIWGGQPFVVDGHPTWHFGPLYPMYLAPFYLLTHDLIATKVAILTLTALSMAVVFLTTRKLYGSAEALLTCAVVLSLPTTIFSSSRNHAELLVVLLYTLTIYFLYRSIEKGHERYVVLAGITAGLAYLSKSTMGYFFVIAGVAGLLWRFKYVRWGVFKDRKYAAAVLIFGAIVGAWGLRNLYYFWWPTNRTIPGLLASWNEDRGYSRASYYVIPTHWFPWTIATLIFVAYAGFLFLSVAWPWLPELRRTWAKRRDQRAALLLVAFVVPAVIGLLVSALYYVYQVWRPTGDLSIISFQPMHQFVLHATRYLMVCLVPLMWLAFEGKKAAERSPNLEVWD